MMAAEPKRWASWGNIKDLFRMELEKLGQPCEDLSKHLAGRIAEIDRMLAHWKSHAADLLLIEFAHKHGLPVSACETDKIRLKLIELVDALPTQDAIIAGELLKKS